MSAIPRDGQSGPAETLREAAATLRVRGAATVHSALAEPLAAWLELTANELDHGGPPPHGALMPHPRWQKPLAVASAILGGET